MPTNRTRKNRMGRFLLTGAVSILLLVGAGFLLVWHAQRQNTLDRTLIAAILRNDTATALRALEQGADANARIYAFEEKPPPLWRQLWDQLRRTHTRDWSETALLALLDSQAPHKPSACTQGVENIPDENITLVKALLAHGARVNEDNWIHSTPLMMATNWNYRETVSVLLAHGANPNLRMDGGSSALMGAARYSDPKLTKALLDAGADPNLQDDLGDTALRQASGGVDERETPFGASAMSVPNMPDAREVVRLLLAHHANVKPKGWRGLTALASAKERHNKTIVKMLTAAGAKQ